MYYSHIMKKLLGIVVLVLLISGNAYPDVATNILKLKSLNACKKCNLQGANLSGANLSGATLCNTIMPWGIENSGC